VRGQLFEQRDRRTLAGELERERSSRLGHNVEILQ
jgi:hypothetical protein